MIAAVLLAAALIRPLPVTPGLTRPLTRTQVCTMKWGRDRRHVTVAMKKRVAARYGIRWVDGRMGTRYEFDHLIPRELAGADDERNLWPQPWTGPWTARMKDRLENNLHVRVCAGTLSLETAQRAIATDWIAAYRRYVDARAR